MDNTNSPEDVWHFVTEPGLRPPKMHIEKNKGCQAKGLIFIAPYGDLFQPTSRQAGSLIVDRKGNPVWFQPAGQTGTNSDFRVQELLGQQVLTFWHLPNLLISPSFIIVNNSYEIVKRIIAKDGYTASPDEFLITPRNTALFLAWKRVPMDLTPYGGPKDGLVTDYSVQEVDLVTQNLVFFWSALGYIPLTDSYVPAPNPASGEKTWDPYHLNSVNLTETPDDIIISGRNTWTIYRVNKPTGMIKWQLGGKRSDFKIGPKANFSWQNDAHLLPDNRISMFDNNCCQPESPIPPGTPDARGLILQLNMPSKTAKLDQAYHHDPDLIVSSHGNMQSLDNGNKFIGWGKQPFFSEYTEPGYAVYDAKILGNNQSDRAYLNEWVGTPSFPPKIAVKAAGDRTVIVYASWNGTTETKYWQVYAGSSPTNLSLKKTHEKCGFETDIKIRTKLSYFQVVALNAEGVELARSEIVKIDEKGEI